MKTINRNFLILTFALIALLFVKESKSQLSYLDKKISITFSKIPVKIALTQIGEEGGFRFSYNSEIIDGERKVSGDFNQQKVKSILNHLMEQDLNYQSVGNHIILLRHETTPKPQQSTIRGKITTFKSGRPVRNATIYEVATKEVTTTDSSGLFTLTLVQTLDFLNLSISKTGYQDTIINLPSENPGPIEVSLKPVHISLQDNSHRYDKIRINNIHQYKMVDWLVPRENRSISNNLTLGNTRLFQVSFAPFVGSNGLFSGSYENRFSLNILAGYSRGNKVAELGGVANIVKGHVNGVQVAGMVNFDGGDMKGVQLSGFMNKNTGSVSGVQIAGFNNLVLDTLRGVQFAGFQNTLHGAMHGIQLSGFNNYTTQNVDGVQFSGFSNIALKDVRLAQLSGFFNLSDDVDGFQFSGFTNVAKGDVGSLQTSGFFNYAKSVSALQLAGFLNISRNKNKGAQISGFMNIAESIRGLQLSGFLNIAGELNGLQLGVVNFSDTVSHGLPLGVFSHVSSGYRTIELSADEVFYTNLTYKSGLAKLYNIFSLGYDWDKHVYGGFGFGTQFRLGNGFHSSVELESRGIFERNHFDYLGHLNKLSYNLEIDLNKNINLTAGPVLKVYLKQDELDPDAPTLAPYTFYDEIHASSRVQAWFGGNFGIQF